MTQQSLSLILTHNVVYDQQLFNGTYTQQSISQLAPADSGRARFGLWQLCRFSQGSQDTEGRGHQLHLQKVRDTMLTVFSQPNSTADERPANLGSPGTDWLVQAFFLLCCLGCSIKNTSHLTCVADHLHQTFLKGSNEGNAVLVRDSGKPASSRQGYTNQSSQLRIFRPSPS